MTMITAEGRPCLDVLGPLNGMEGQCILVERTVGSDVAVIAGISYASERVRGHEDISAMCFSATASFTAAAVTGSIGALTLRSAAAKHDYQALPIAAFPLLFAAQQLTEGFLWLDLASPESGMHRTILIHAFQGYAEVFWPVFAPLAAFFIEPERRRRRLILLCLAVGALLSAYLLTTMVAHPYYAFVGSGHIIYENDFQHPAGIEIPYIVATTISLLLSSHKVVQLLAVVIFVGFAVAYISFYEAYTSIWCFFAAAASALVYLFISRAPRSDLQPRAL